MAVTILLISDIHANYPALHAIDRQVRNMHFDLIINGGDSTVYATFPNETLAWLREHKAVSILGNTDVKMLRLLAGKKMKKPRKAEKRIMYTWTADHLTPKNRDFLAAIPNRLHLDIEGYRIGLFHGSPDNDNEHLFADSPSSRFQKLASKSDFDLIITGHSHSPYHKLINKVHFINPGSVGRMFDGQPDGSYAVLRLAKDNVRVDHFRCPYPVEELVASIRQNQLPSVYEAMYRSGRKLN